MNIREAIAQARLNLEEGCPHLANYVLRDFAEVKEAGLDDLAWSMHRHPPHKNDVLFLIERLEAWLEA